MPEIDEENHELISTTEELARFCASLADVPFVTVDTEFMRESTFWPKLCLVQLAGPEGEARAIDPLAPGIDLAPLFALMRSPKVLKVFHAARQDLEIFYILMGEVPAPLFDTQVAAMVCGFGDQAGYETLARQLAKAEIDKSSRFTDWSRRPLSSRQITYALADVTHLRIIYAKLAAKLGQSGRQEWLGEEMSLLSDPNTYRQEPEEAWRRLKTRTSSRKFLAVLKALAAWREREAQTRDIPRQRILRDEALLEMASHPPRDAEHLAHVRGVSKGLADGRMGESILAAIKRGIEMPPEEIPQVSREEPPKGAGPLGELLKVLLKLKCDEEGVAQKLVASSSDIDHIGSDDAPDVPAMHGWRFDVFGRDAMDLKAGRIALAAQGRTIKLLRLPISS